MTEPSDFERRYSRPDALSENLRTHSVRAGAATLLAQACKFAIGIGSTAILARLLTPRDFGLIAMVLALTGFVDRFRDMGLAVATIQRPEITHRQVSTLFWVNTSFGAALTLAMTLVAPAIAWFYGEPRLKAVTIALAVTFLLGGLSIQHQALLRRQMRFGVLAVVQVGSVLAAAVLAVAAGWAGLGYWSLVVMQIVAALVNMLGLLSACAWRPSLPTRGAGIRAMLSFGGTLAGSNMLQYLIRNCDNLLIGWRLGAESLGLYSKAYQLLLLPISQLNVPLTGVAIPTLSRLQAEPDRYRLYYQRGVQLLVTVGMPLVVFTFVAADEIVSVVLGQQWTGAAAIFRALAPAAFVDTFAVATAWVFVSLGDVRRQFRWMLFSAVVILTAFCIGLRWGVIGVASAFSVCQCALVFPAVAYCFRRTPLRGRDLAAVLWRPAVCAAVAGLASSVLLGTGSIYPSGSLQPAEAILSLLTTGLLPSSLPAIGSLLIVAFVYGLLYATCWMVVPDGRRILRETLSLLKDVRSRTLAPPPDPDR